MAAGQQFSLRWNNYSQHIVTALEELRVDDELTDVTLSCEGQRVKAHKLLLSACSVFFKDTFKENPCKHPIIILKGVTFADLQAVIQFMYNGQVNVTQDRLPTFLQTAEILQIKGLTDNASSSEKEDTPPVAKKRAHTMPPQVSTVTDAVRQETESRPPTPKRKRVVGGVGSYMSAQNSELPGTASVISSGAGNGSVSVGSGSNGSHSNSNQSNPPPLHVHSSENSADGLPNVKYEEPDEDEDLQYERNALSEDNDNSFQDNVKDITTDPNTLGSNVRSNGAGERRPRYTLQPSNDLTTGIVDAANGLESMRMMGQRGNDDESFEHHPQDSQSRLCREPTSSLHEPEVVVGISRRGHPKLFIGSYSYVQLRSRIPVAPSEANLWRCYKMNCRGRVAKADGSYVLSQAHTCKSRQLEGTLQDLIYESSSDLKKVHSFSNVISNGNSLKLKNRLSSRSLSSSGSSGHQQDDRVIKFAPLQTHSNDSRSNSSQDGEIQFVDDGSDSIHGTDDDDEYHLQQFTQPRRSSLSSLSKPRTMPHLQKASIQHNFLQRNNVTLNGTNSGSRVTTFGGNMKPLGRTNGVTDDSSPADVSAPSFSLTQQLLQQNVLSLISSNGPANDAKRLTSAMAMSHGNNSSNNLMEHPIIAPYVCDICGKRYVHHRSLNDHKKSHTGATRCPVCNKSFSKVANMRAHYANSHTTPNEGDEAVAQI